jgi:hypothetical protein
LIGESGVEPRTLRHEAGAVVVSFISNTRRAMDIAVAVVASFIEAAVVAVAVTSSKSWAKVIAGAVVVAT